MSTNFWNFRGYNPTNTEDAALASRNAYIAQQANNMQGYQPLPNMQGYYPTYGGRQVDPGFNPATQPQLQQYEQNAQLLNLKDEYDRNTQRIMEIEQELAMIEKQTGKNLDDFDMQLAQNRASIGDIGNAQMHLNRIDQRRAAALGKAGNTDKDRIAAEDEIDRLYVAMAGADPAQQAQYKNYIERKEKDYERVFGKPYSGAVRVPTGKQDSGSVSTFAGYDSVLEQELKANGNNGRLSNQQIAKLQSILDTLPSGGAHNERQTALDAIKSNEKHDADVKAQKAKENAALDEITKKVTGFGLKKGESKTVTASNGKSVTVTRLTGGKVQYKCGSTTR